MSNEVYLTDNFLSDDMCNWFMSFHQTMFPLYGSEFENRRIINLTELTHVLYNNNLPYDVTDYLKIVQANLTTEVRKHDPQAFPNYIHCTEWTAPIYQPIHTDFDEHVWTSILYLNDNFTGGNTIIEGERIPPKKRSVITFKGELKHGVEEVTEGNRYTISVWYKNHIGVNKYR